MIEARIGHAQLFTLIHERRALKEMQRRAEHLRRHHPMLTVMTKTRDHTRLVVVTPEQRVPAATSLHPGLPIGEDALECEEIEIGANPLLQVRVINLQVMKVEGHRQFFRLRSRVANAVFQTGGRHLADVDQVMAFEHFAVHLLQVVVDVRAVGVEAPTVTVVLGEVRRFGNQVDHVQPETADAFVTPETHHLEDFGTHLGVVPVQVGLSVVEQVQVVLTGLGLVLPGRTAKLGFPVVRLVAPDVEIAVRVIEAAAGLLEPGVSIEV